SLEIGELQFDAQPDQRAVLLTFTRTLAKFENYVTTVLGVDRISGLVQTVDAFILERLKRIDQSYKFDFTVVEALCTELNTTEFFDDVELAAEIETFLFGNVVTHEEYTDEIVPRVGMRRRLARGQREAVWAIRDQIVGRMNDVGAFSRNYARIKILDYLAAGDKEKGQLLDVRTIYLDETQDLTSGDLITLKALISGHLIMASDLQQSIYGVSSPFVRAGIRISGRTKVLRTNFRNTRQIHETAQRFQSTDEDSLFAFRDGPIPELYTATAPEDLLPLLIGKLGLFLNHLEYEPDNICVLAPHTAEVSRIADALAQHNIPAAVITDREFQFSTTGAVRLSTLHSSKGLDFPVVLVYLPYLNRREKFDEETTDRLLRNLIYVGFTRAMENLNVFVCP
ncbi:MAG: ATP-binding domain-containing protein, partial [Spirochaetaceae bacterium]|nr:ATP-binding domain-containing protein [Spirochaetaceae bacterium]